MAPIPRYVLIPLRLGQLSFGAIVSGILGYFIANLFETDPEGFSLGRWIYVEVLAGFTIIFSVLFLLPTFLEIFVWPIDIVISLGWFAAFGLVLYALDGIVCGNNELVVTISDPGNCSMWEVVEAFSFLSAFTWLVTGFLGLYFVWRSDSATGYGKDRGHKTYDV